MPRTVVILGAGASRSCGAPLMFDFLDRAEAIKKSGNLDTELSQHFSTVFDAIHELERAHTKASLDTNNVEDVFAAFEMAELLQLSFQDGSLSAAMPVVIAKTVEANIRFPVGRRDSNKAVIPPEDYRRLAKWIRDQTEEGEEVSVITFNYDCALDYALWWHEVPVSYGIEGMATNPSSVRLLKLHGSLNWVRRGDDITVVTLPEISDQMNRFFYNVAIRNGDSAPFPTTEFVKHHLGGDADGSGVAIVPPVWSKVEHYKTLGSVWRAAAQVLRPAERIYVSGYSLPGTDQFFRHLYALGTIGPTRIKSFEVWDPDANVEDRYLELLGPAIRDRFQFKQETMEEMLNSLPGSDSGPTITFV